MAQQVINIGAFPNDGTGDPLRTAMTKTNANFTELYSTSTFTTGDAKLTFKTTADPTWIMANDGSIGNAASGATTLADPTTVALYTLLYNNIPFLVVQNSSGIPVVRGPNAAADYAANRRLVIPATLGRSIANAGAGAGLTARTLGAADGAEANSFFDTPFHSHPISPQTVLQTNGSLGVDATTGPYYQPSAQVAATPPNTGSFGTGSAFSIMNPRSYMNVMIKL